MDLTLGRMQAALNELGLARPARLVAQVLGSNGKGSTATFLAEFLSAHGQKTLLFTSPHFLSERERILLDGACLDKALWLGLANQAMQAQSAALLTYFELLTLIAVLAAAKLKVDAAVFEAGLGGRYDSTSALTRDLLLYAPIGLDHQGVLGRTLSEIARDKAGAMRPGQMALSASQPAAVRSELRIAAAAAQVNLRSPLAVLPRKPRLAAPTLAGAHQVANARLALAGFCLLGELGGFALDPKLAAQALRTAFLPGRMQFLPGEPGLILDSGHNPPALRGLAKALAERGVTPKAMIFACLADKNVKLIAPLAAKLSPGPILVPEIPDNPRALPAKDLAAMLGSRARPLASIEAALAELSGQPGPVLICGSMYLLAEYYKLYPQSLERPE